MKHLLFCMMLMTLINITVMSQSTVFERVYGQGNNDAGICSVPYGTDYYLCGNINTATNSNEGALIKTDSTGQQQWSVLYGGTGSDILNHIERTNDNHLILCGQTASSGAGSDDGWIMKTDSTGVVLWQKTIGGVNSDKLYDIQQMPDSGYIAVGETYSFGANTPGSPNMYIVRLNKNGDTLWTKTLDYGGANSDIARSVAVCNNGSVLIAGKSTRWESTYLRTDLRLTKINAAGTSVWSRTYSTTIAGDHENPCTVLCTPDTGFIVSGYSSSSGWNYGFLIKTDSLGNNQWYRQVSGASLGDDCYIKSCALTSDSGFVLTGYINDPYTCTGDPLGVWKYNSSGTLLWTRIFGGTSTVYPDEGNHIRETADKGFVITGVTRTNSLYGQNDIYLIKTDSMGYNSLAIHASPDVTICAGDTATLQVYSNFSNISISWTPALHNVYPDSCTTLVFPDSIRKYYVSVTSGTTTITDSIVVTVNQLPGTPSGNINGSLAVCQGVHDVSYTAPNISDALSYEWTLPDGSVQTGTQALLIDFGLTAGSGDISVRGINNCGFGPSVTIYVTVNPKPAKPVISITGNTLHSDALSGNQWYDSNGPVAGATGQDYTPTTDGNYYVVVTASGCSSENSDTVQVNWTGFEHAAIDVVRIYPNPTPDCFEFSVEKNEGIPTGARVFNPFGQVIHEGFIKTGDHTYRICLNNDIPSGCYQLEIILGNSSVFRKIVKQ